MGYVDPLVVFGLPLGLVGLFVLPFLRVGVDLSDEGYLVFGTACVLDGKIPIRDFRAYDPGRYYWCGAFGLVFGRGYFATRIAMAVMMAVALSVFAALILRGTGAPLIGGLSCALALIWMQPRTKQIENFFVILSMLLLFNLTQDGGRFEEVALGVALGLAAFFGLNIFVYLVAASVLVGLLGFGLIQNLSLASFGVGLGVGFLPVLLMGLMARGYARDYLRRKLIALLRRGTTNLKLPLPWLWTREKTRFDQMPPLHRWSFRGLFTLMPMLFFCGLSLPLVVEASALSDALRLVFVASAVGLVSFHHTVSRADLVHIFQPTLCLAVVLSAGSFALLGPIGAMVLLCLALVGSVGLVWTELFHLPKYRKVRDDLEPLDCATDRLWLPAQLRAQIEALQQVTQTYTTKDAPILAVPVQIGLCTLFERQHAAYDSFPVYPSQAPARRAMMEDLERSRPKLLLIETMAVDARKELIFLKNYPNVAELIASEYVQLSPIGKTEVYVRADVI